MKVLLALILLAGPSEALCCSYIQLGNQTEYASAQNFDFPPEVMAGIVINQRHVEKSDASMDGNPGTRPVEWVSEYGSVTFGFGVDSAATGVNEAGLRVYRF